MPKQLNNGKITQALQRAFGFKGRFNPLLDEIIVPVYQISDPVPAAPVPTCIGTIEAPGLADTTTFAPSCALSNPLGSGVLISVTAVAVATFKDAPGPATDAAAVDFFFNAAPFSDGTKKGFFRDQRLTSEHSFIGGGPERSLGLFSFNTTFPAASLPFSEVIATSITKTAGDIVALEVGVAQQVRQPLCVLPPGVGLGAKLRGDDPSVYNDLPLLFSCAWVEISEQYAGPPGGTP